MTQLIVLPHPESCPDGAVIEAEEGKSICETLLENGVELDHACEMSCACTTCHVIVREGFSSLEPAEDTEEDLLDKAWGLEPNSRLGCQAIVGSTPLVGMLGARAERWRLVTASAVILPALTCGSMPGVASTPPSTSPDSTALTAGLLPL